MKNETAVSHTPGPWITAGRAVYTPSAWKDGRDSGQIMVAQCFAEADRDTPECADFLGAVKVPSNDCEAEANARLIASAPEMLAIAQRWMTWATGPVVPIAIRMQLQEDTRAAIAKATA